MFTVLTKQVNFSRERGGAQVPRWACERSSWCEPNKTLSWHHTDSSLSAPLRTVTKLGLRRLASASTKTKHRKLSIPHNGSNDVSSIWRRVNVECVISLSRDVWHHWDSIFGSYEVVNFQLGGIFAPSFGTLWFSSNTTHSCSSLPHPSSAQSPLPPTPILSFYPFSIIGFYFRAAIRVSVSCVCVSHPIFRFSAIVTLCCYRSPSYRLHVRPLLPVYDSGFIWTQPRITLFISCVRPLNMMNGVPKTKIAKYHRVKYCEAE